MRPNPPLGAARWSVATLVLALLTAATLSAQNDPTTQQPVFREPKTVVPSMNGGAENVLRAIYDDQLVPRLVRKSDGTASVVEEMIMTHTWNRSVPGDTYRVMPGETLPITVMNDLNFNFTVAELKTKKILGRNDGTDVENFIHSSMNTTNLHVHGLHVSPSGFSDNVLLHALQGKKIPYSYNIPPQHAPGTHWYHPHFHGATALQVTEGMVGALLVGEPRGQNLTPTGYTAKEDLLVIRANTPGNDIGTFPNMELALRSLADQSPEAAGDQMAQLLQALKSRMPEIDKKMAELAKEGQLERMIQAVEDLLSPPTFTVNGLLNPVDEIVPNQLVRMRIVNAGSRNGDYKSLYLSGHDIFLAAMDGINLTNLPTSNEPGKSFAGFVAYNKDNPLPLTPGNRADVYFIASGVGSHTLMMNRTPRFGQPAEGTQELMTFEVSRSDFSGERLTSPEDYNAELTRFLIALDGNLKRLQGVGAYAPGGYLADISKAKVDAERTMVFDVTQGKDRPFYINSRSYNGSGSHADHTSMAGAQDYLGNKIGDGGRGPQGQDPWPIRRGTVEKWTIKNISNANRHSFHIHVNPFWVVGISVNGVPVPANDPRLNRWQDTLDLPPGGEVTVLHRFQEFEGLFVLHCHILQHEDRGMMINVLIVPPADTNPQAYFEKQVAANAKLNDQINN